MSRNDRPDQLRVIQSGTDICIDIEHFERWQKFKRQWSRQDKANWEAIMDRLHVTSFGTLELIPPLSAKEKLWADKLIRKAEALHLFDDTAPKLLFSAL